ncbi:MAG: hypothetical protein ACT4O3_02135, partial [Elusimicrobiota bacterium]
FWAVVRRAVLGGWAVAAGGLGGMLHWGRELFIALKGLAPVCFFLGGLAVTLIGLSSLKAPARPAKTAKES